MKTTETRELRAISAAARADLIDRFSCLLMALLMLGLVIAPLALAISARFTAMLATLPH